ncbi:MAG: rhamnan synthesis F family protein [Robiginitomaculum sp.]|nr:rhamnan synthesis F family protein [Robiginitomaculum sp.]
MKKIWNMLRRFWMLFFGARERNDYVVQYVKFAWALIFGRGTYIRQRWGNVPDAKVHKDVAIFVHYDKQGRVHGYILQYIKALQDAGRAVIFITNSPKFPDEERRKLNGLCEPVLWRKNKGYDFGAYADGMKLLGDLSAYNSITLCNDSAYGPLFPLDTVYQAMDPAIADMWGLTDSWDSAHHMQSYFLVFHQAVLRNAAFQKRWHNYIHVPSKSWVIRKHEIGLSSDMRKAGLRTRAVFPYRVLLADFFDHIGDASILQDKSLLPSTRKFLKRIFEHAEHGVPLNVTHFFWDRLITEFQYPFIKKEILQSNPSALPSLYLWEKLIRGVSDYDTDLITRHLEFTMRGRFM